MKTITIIALALAFAACQPQPVTEDDLPEDIYSVMQVTQAHYDSVLVERATLTEIVVATRSAVGGYLNAVDARGNVFSANGVIQDALQACMDATARLPEVLEETQELLIALDKGQVGLERFKLRFAAFDEAWQAENDCWRGVFADPLFDGWRVRWAAQADSVSMEAAQARRAARAARAARARAQVVAAERERAFNACVQEWRSDVRFPQKRESRGGSTFLPNMRTRYVQIGTQRLAEYVRGGAGDPTYPAYRFVSFGANPPSWVDRSWWEAWTFKWTGQASREGREAAVSQWMAAGHPGCER